MVSYCFDVKAVGVKSAKMFPFILQKNVVCDAGFGLASILLTDENFLNLTALFFSEGYY